jgi:hypothetical protein
MQNSLRPLYYGRLSSSILEYADVVWDNKTLFLINKLENVQIEAARVVKHYS